MKIVVCGDTMPGGILPYQEQYISSDLLGFMKSFDFRVGTLECAIGTDLPFDEVKMRGRMNIIYARDEDFYRVKEMGFDVVTLANNHVWDLGVEGLKNTIKVLRDNGILYCGAGMDIEEASRPAVVEKDGLTVAFLGYCMYDSPYLGHVELAGDGKPGICPLDIDKAVADIRSAKLKYDKVVVLPHWGREYVYRPLPQCVEWAKQMVEAGADAVLASHSHQLQPMVKIKGVPVCYCMGNFMFPDFYMCPPRPMWYPEQDVDRKAIKSTLGYPFPIEEPMLQVWKPLGRLSRMVTLDISANQVRAKSIFTENDTHNVVAVTTIGKKVKIHLWKESASLRFPLFRSIYSWVKRIVKSLSK